jgi:tetratricopeptide (TPR) repeat protein
VKWARRRPAVTALLASLVLAVVGGFAGMAGFWLRAEEQRAAAERERHDALEAKEQADQERAVAQAVQKFLQNDLLRQADSRAQANRKFEPNPKVTVRELLDRAAAGIEQRFQNQPHVAAAIRQAIGDAYRGVGAHELAIRHLTAVHKLRTAHFGPDHRDTLGTLNNLGLAYLDAGRTAEAIRLFEQVREQTLKALGPDHPDTLVTLHNLAGAYRVAGRTAEAIRMFEQVREQRLKALGADDSDTLTALDSLAAAYYIAGHTAEAIRLFEQVRERRIQTLGRDHPDTPGHAERPRRGVPGGRPHRPGDPTVRAGTRAEAQSIGPRSPRHLDDGG